MHEVAYTVITPSKGDRPRALAAALHSVLVARHQAGLPPDAVEVLVGFDGCPGVRVVQDPAIRYTTFPKDGNYGNAIRNGLLKAAKGRRLLFLDDDNVLTPQAFQVYERYPDADLVIARIDTSRSLDLPFIPQVVEGEDPVRHTNVDPLCLCAERELVTVRCKGWGSEGGYASDYHNILAYYRRARKVVFAEALVGIYDFGLGLDHAQLSSMQQLRLWKKVDRGRV